MNSPKKNSDDLNKNYQFKKREPSEILVTALGYYWIVFSVILSFWQLGDNLFKFTANFTLGVKIGAIAVIAIVPIGISLLLTRFVPVLLLRLGNKSSHEKYFNTSTEDQLKYLRSTLYLTLPENDEKLLYTLQKALEEKRYADALTIAKNNSRLFHVFSKNFLRMKNGLYAYYALYKQTKGIRETTAVSYVKNYFCINDIGLCFIKISKNNAEIREFNKFIKEDKYYQEIKEILNFGIDSFKKEDCVAVGLEILSQAQRRLEKQKRHYNLIAQAIRHHIYYYISNHNALKIQNLMEKFQETIAEIKNAKDKKEMQAYMEYIRATLVNDEIKRITKDDLIEALDHIDKAQDKFEEIDDESRMVKCYKVRGQLYLHLAEIENEHENRNKACACFYDGKKYSEKIARYDQVMENLWLLVKNGANKAKKLAEEGLNIAQKLQNTEFADKFSAYLNGCAA